MRKWSELLPLEQERRVKVMSVAIGVPVIAALLVGAVARYNNARPVEAMPLPEVAVEEIIELPEAPELVAPAELPGLVWHTPDTIIYGAGKPNHPEAPEPQYPDHTQRLTFAEEVMELSKATGEYTDPKAAAEAKVAEVEAILAEVENPTEDDVKKAVEQVNNESQPKAPDTPKGVTDPITGTFFPGGWIEDGRIYYYLPGTDILLSREVGARGEGGTAPPIDWSKDPVGY